MHNDVGRRGGHCSSMLELRLLAPHRFMAFTLTCLVAVQPVSAAANILMIYLKELKSCRHQFRMASFHGDGVVKRKASIIVVLRSHLQSGAKS